MSHPDPVLLGKLALKLGMLNADQLHECVSEQERSSAETEEARPLGAIMIAKGFITPTQLDKLLKAQKEALEGEHEWLGARKEDALFGKLLVKFRFVTPDKVNECLRVQAQMHDHGLHVRLGEILVRRGYLTPAEVADTLRLQQIAIMECGACHATFNVPQRIPGDRYFCPKCRGEMHLRGPGDHVAVAGSLDSPGAARGRTQRR
ncbi:MAG: hypothetical protein RDV41_07770, partial [Planctomycetota bacterium]|nr:hypothetical protein [Planctomycetota bacterium]